ncbi:MAG: S41 family peptidase, partial [Candidimonas sp.]|nr:S41 family peptidase [Candidimonas sp.]
TIVRDLIKVRSVRSKMLDDGIAYVRIAQFQERTVQDLARQLGELSATAQPKALILDLRNDPGGLLDSAIGVSSAFLPPDVLVVSTKGRIPSSNREYFAKPVDTMRSFLDSGSVQPAGQNVSDWAKTVPMVVLVNVGSASASEIVAGALQDHKRAKIMGNRTFGKGSVQSVLPLSETTGIKLTTARYFTPAGRSIQVTGVEPDILVDDTAQGNLFRLPREVDLERHLHNATLAEEQASKADAADDESLPKMFEFGGADDYQLKQAINLLEGRAVKRRDPSLVAAKTEAQATDQATDQAKSESSTDDAAAEKKNPLSPASGVERYRITPEGLIPAQ